MTNYIDKLYSKYHFSDMPWHKKMKKLKKYNRFLSWWYSKTSWLPFNRLKKNTNKTKTPRIIISFTTFPVRIGSVWMTVESLLRQKTKPDKIVLWLSREEFNDISSLPKKLLNQQKRGLEIKLIPDNLRSHKKYFYAFQEYPNDVVITVDDDTIYNANFIKVLVKAHTKYPTTICSTIATPIRFKDGQIEPYSEWRKLPIPYNVPSLGYLACGVGGVLYPPHSLSPLIFNEEAIKKYAYPVDDLWLKAGEILQGVGVVKIELNSSFMGIYIENDLALSNTNLTGGNDIHLSLIRKYFKDTIGRDPFEEINGIAAKDTEPHKENAFLPKI